MARPYASPREHLDAALRLVQKMFERQIHAHWEAGLLPRMLDEFSGTFVSSDEVSAILGRVRSGGPTPAGQETIATRDRAIAGLMAEREARLAVEGGDRLLT